jgi:hypothetical protein
MTSSVILSSAEINKRIIRLKKMQEENEKFYDKFQIWKHAVEQSDRKKELSTMKELKMITDNFEINKPKNNITTSDPKKKGRKKHDIYR